MSKIMLPKPRTLLYPLPVIIVGSMIDGKPNYCTIAFCGIVNLSPPMISIYCGPSHYTTKGILKNMEFSVNIPSIEMVEVTDFIGIKSGSDYDKSTIFDVFFGDLKNAPLISTASVNHACKVVKIVELANSMNLYIGQIINTYVSKDCLTNGIPDVKKINPITFSPSNRTYWSIGQEIGKAYKIGRNNFSKIL
ncbi:MAG: flavin reductase family protein [Candidatus Hermodarchaeota archaeon]